MSKLCTHNLQLKIMLIIVLSLLKVIFSVNAVCLTDHTDREYDTAYRDDYEPLASHSDSIEIIMDNEDPTSKDAPHVGMKFVKLAKQRFKVKENNPIENRNVYSDEELTEFYKTEDQVAKNELHTTTKSSCHTMDQNESAPQRRKLGPVYGIRYNSSMKTQKKSDTEAKSTTIRNYPFAVSIQRKGIHYATGALIDKKWILSSGAEFYNVRESIKLFRVRLGSVSCKKNGILLPLKRVEIHPSYVYGEPNFDMSLLRIAKPLEYTEFIRPIVLSRIRRPVVSAKFLTTYWSRVIVKGQPLPSDAKERTNHNTLRVLTQNLIPRNECLFFMKGRNITIHDSTLCLVPSTKHHSFCVPDAGAPLIADDGLWGITSGWTAKDCKNVTSPTVFTRVSSFVIRSWLGMILDIDRY